MRTLLTLLRLARSRYEILRGPAQSPWLLWTREEKEEWRSEKRVIAVRESEAFKRELKRESRELAHRSIQLVRENLAVQVACAFACGAIALLVVLALL